MATASILTLALFIVAAQSQGLSPGPTGFSDQIFTATPSFHGTDGSLTIRASEQDIPSLKTNVITPVLTNNPAASLLVSAEGASDVGFSSMPAELSSLSQSSATELPHQHSSATEIPHPHSSATEVPHPQSSATEIPHPQSSATEMTASMDMSSHFMPPSHGLFSTQSASVTFMPLPSSHIPHPSPTESVNITTSSASHDATSIVPSLTSAVMPSSSTIAPTPTPVVKYECGPQCKSLKHRMMAAVGFAVILGIICVVLAFLLWRQYRAQNSDGSTGFSRLI